MDFTTSHARSSLAALDPATSLDELTDLPSVDGVAPPALEEALVTDARAGLTPAQMVERKLIALLKTNPLPVSQLMAGSRSLRVR